MQSVTALVVRHHFYVEMIKKVFGVDERRGSEIIFENIPHSKLALFKDAFDPLSTMRRDQFNEVVMDFLTNNDLKTYTDVRYLTK